MLSLKQRCIAINIKWGLTLSVTYLSMLYKKHGIRYAAPQYVNSGAFFKRDLADS